MVAECCALEKWRLQENDQHSIEIFAIFVKRKKLIKYFSKCNNNLKKTPQFMLKWYDNTDNWF